MGIAVEKQGKIYQPQLRATALSAGCFGVEYRVIAECQLRDNQQIVRFLTNLNKAAFFDSAQLLHFELAHQYLQGFRQLVQLITR